MPNFPTLSRQPSYPLDETYVDDVIKTPTEAGYEQRRPRFTKRKKTFVVRYNILPNADKALIDNFYKDTLKGADSFIWTHPLTGTNYTVVFEQPPSFTLVFLGYWNVELRFREL